MRQLSKLVIGLSVFLGSCKTNKGTEAESDLELFQPKNLRGQSELTDKVLALTIDDGPSATTWKILDELDKINTEFSSPDGCAVKATFFITGKSVTTSAKSKYISRIRNHPKKCYIMGNHTFNHPDAPTLTSNLTSEIRKGHEVLKPLFVPGQVRFFRAPGGASINAVTANNAAPEDYVGPMFWDIGGAITGSATNPTDAADWACWSSTNRPSTWTDANAVDQCFKGYVAKTERLKKGIVLFHDLNSKSLTLVSKYVRSMLSKGYKFVRLDEIESFAKLALNRVGNGDQPIANPVPQEGASPCTSSLKGACVSKEVCDQISSGSVDYSTRYSNFNLLKGQANSFVATYCPRDPVAIKCCYSPASGGLALNENSQEKIIENSVTEKKPKLMISQRLDSGEKCVIEQDDIENRKFYFYSHLEVDKSECAMTKLDEIQKIRQENVVKYLTELKQFANACFKNMALASYAGYGSNETQNIADFSLAGMRENSSEQTFDGSLTLHFNKNLNHKVEIGNMTLFSGQVQQKTLQSLHVQNKTSDHNHDEVHSHPHSAMFDLTTDDKNSIDDSCAMVWSGKISVSKMMGSHEKIDQQTFLIIPANFY